MLRKLILLFGMVLLAVVPIGAQDEDVTLTVTHFFEGDPGTVGELIDNQLGDYLAAHPNVTLNVEINSHDEYIEKFKVLAAGRELPDVFIINGDQITGVGGAGMLADLSGDLDADPEWRDLQVPGGMREWIRGDAVYALPNQMIITHVIYWNEAIFAEVGLEEFPDTWEGLLEAMALLSDGGYVPIAFGNVARWPGYSPMFGTLSFRGHGIDWYNRLLNFDAEFTDEEFIRGLEAFVDLVEAGAFNEDANSIDTSQAQAMYFNREAAMFVEGDWAINTLNVDAPQDILDDTNLAVWPGLSNGSEDPTEVTWAAGWGWAINSELEGAEREAAVELVKYLSNEDYGRQRIELGLLSAQAVTDFDETQLSQLNLELNEMLADLTGVPLLTIAFPPSVTDMLGIGLQELMTGQTTPEELAEEMQEEYENYR